MHSFETVENPTEREENPEYTYRGSSCVSHLVYIHIDMVFLEAAVYCQRIFSVFVAVSFVVGVATFGLVHNSQQFASLSQSVNLRSRINRGSVQVQSSTLSSISQSKPSQLPHKMASVPAILYGTAWKKDRTASLVEQAIRAGFRGIDTACQPKHYYEPGVGEAVFRSIQQGLIKREDLFLQTKFTPIGGQDLNSIPYDPHSSIPEQVRTSFAVSLRNLQTTYLDSLVIHSPMQTIEETMSVWRVFEEFHRAGQVRFLGLSNTYNLRVLKSIYDQAEVKPSFLQNRFYRETGYDVEIRRFCLEKGIQYQSFWTLTANPHIVNSEFVHNLARKYNKTNEQIFFRFVQHLGILPLSGTTNPHHMEEDLALPTFSLEEEEVRSIETILYH